LVIGAFFYYLRARNNPYSAYADVKRGYTDLERRVVSFKGAKARAEVVSSDVITTEEKNAQMLSNKIQAVEDSIERIAEMLRIMQHPGRPVEELKAAQ
jgi:hypothetical protein